MVPTAPGGTKVYVKAGYDVDTEDMQAILNALANMPGWLYDALKGDNIKTRIRKVAKDEGVLDDLTGYEPNDF
jgi:hypothetical protein